jgi:hypothetical protein
MIDFGQLVLEKKMWVFFIFSIFLLSPYYFFLERVIPFI